MSNAFQEARSSIAIKRQQSCEPFSLNCQRSQDRAGSGLPITLNFGEIRFPDGLLSQSLRLPTYYDARPVESQAARMHPIFELSPPCLERLESQAGSALARRHRRRNQEVGFAPPAEGVYPNRKPGADDLVIHLNHNPLPRDALVEHPP
jgi:hypothetical protein